MNQIHETLITYIREETQKDPMSELSVKFSSITNEAMIRLMFASYRKNEESRGLRLTKFGLQVMKQFFHGYDVPMPEGEILKSRHLLYLERKSTMPYFCDQTGFTLYDHKLGIKLKLADGKINTLIDIEK